MIVLMASLCAGPWEHLLMAGGGAFFGYKIGTYNFAGGAWASLIEYGTAIPPAPWTPSPNTPTLAQPPALPVKPSECTHARVCIDEIRARTYADAKAFLPP